MTFGEWQRRATRVAHALSAAGVEHADRVVLALARERWLDHLVAYFGIQKAGATPVLLNPDATAQELEAVLRQVAPRMIIAEEGPAGDLRSELLVRPAELESCDACGRSRKLSGPHPDDLADILFTSGSTGTPKGVATTHRNLLATAGRPPAPWRGRTFFHAMPPWTAIGAQGVVTMQLRGAMDWVTQPAFDPKGFCEIASRCRPYLLYLVPASAALLAETTAPLERACASLKVIMLVGAAPSQRAMTTLAARLPHVLLLNVYGLTEAGGAQIVGRYDPRSPERIGRAVGTTEAKIVSGGGEIVPSGETGEICLRRRGVVNRRYYGDTDATSKVFIDGWVRTGDLGFIDEHENVHVIGRLKDIIITGGLNVSAVEVEAALAQHPAVAEVAAAGKQHDVVGETVVAAVVTRAPASENELRKFARSQLGRQKAPTEVMIVDALPRTATGKIAKPAVAALFERRKPTQQRPSS